MTQNPASPPEQPTPPGTPPGPPPEPSWGEVLAIPLGLLGAILGGLLGGYIFALLLKDGYHAAFLVGGVVGFATIGLARRGGLILALLATPIALVSSVLAEWSAAPFRDDPSLGFFIRHLSNLTNTSKIFHLLGAALAFYIVISTPARKDRPH